MKITGMRIWFRTTTGQGLNSGIVVNETNDRIVCEITTSNTYFPGDLVDVAECDIEMVVKLECSTIIK